MSAPYGGAAKEVRGFDLDTAKPSRAPGSVSKNFNRFSSFVKHGGEAYILGKADARVTQIDQVLML